MGGVSETLNNKGDRDGANIPSDSLLALKSYVDSQIKSKISEALGTIDYVIASGDNGAGKYWRKYKSGYIIQWGTFGLSSNGNQTFTLPISFATTEYWVDTLGESSSTSSNGAWSFISKTYNTVTGRFPTSGTRHFYACGY